MEALNSIESFVLSAESGSFSAAARRLGLTPAAVSKNVARLEASLGLRLFQRTTRNLTLTAAGERFLRDVADPFSAVRDAIANAATHEGKPSGALKVSMALAFGREYLLPLLGEFLNATRRSFPTGTSTIARSIWSRAVSTRRSAAASNSRRESSHANSRGLTSSWQRPLRTWRHGQCRVIPAI
ncbi:DNA-binding transcriptional LysR family regulator [Paraburkholderia caledonica]|uniref:DNA-binding transcriptional LysR family regulator n=1 Tax=Paraburkholderia caledonica TaxID=134536 RepID=A0AB73I7V5_9BURK|nr:DNA-binding transcriptional LysR family regulator [Paraburkholderia caledonica]